MSDTSNNTKTITISGKEWAALLTFASKDAARVNLHGIAIYEDGTMAATDGHSLVQRIVDESTPSKERGTPRVVRYDDVKQLSKLAGSRGTIVMTPTDTGWDVLAGGTNMSITAGERVFPPIHAVSRVPSPTDPIKPGEAWGIDAKLLGRSCSALEKVHCGDKGKGVSVQVWGPLDAIHVECQGDKARWFVVLMPVRL